MYEKRITPQPGRDLRQASSPRRRLSLLYISITGSTERPYLDPSTRYRCFNAAEAARALGHAAFVTTQVGMDRIDAAAFDAIIIHRPAWSHKLIRLARDARRVGTKLIADYDDLIFDPAYATQSSMFVRSQDCTSVMATFERNTDALHMFDHFTVSTEPLADHIRGLHPTATVQVLANAVSPSLWAGLQRKAYETRSDREYIGYFPGTATHDKDFAVAAPSVAAFCRARKIPLLIVGPLRPNPAQLSNVQVVHHALQPFETMFEIIASCRTVLAPLASSPFNQSKSHVKLLEAALACSKCIASDIPDMKRHVSIPNIITPLSNDASEWNKALDESWDTFDVNKMAAARQTLVQEFDSRRVHAPLLEMLSA